MLRNTNAEIKKQLSIVSHYEINLVAIDKNTYSIQISDSHDQVVLVDLPLDPMDNTLAATLDKNILEKFGTDAEKIFAELSTILQEQIGAKEFIVVPTKTELPGFIPVQNHQFKRVRQATRDDLINKTAVELEKHKELVAILDEEYELVVGARELASKVEQPYHRIFDLLNNYANFTDSKMTEYKLEDIQGITARVNNSNITLISLVDKKRNLCGILRCLAMKNEFGYLSDETVNQNILPLEKFSGETTEDKAKNRSKFLLAYFANKAVAFFKEQNQFVIIAASGREDVYESAGFQTFPIKADSYVATIKLGQPGPLLNAIKSELLTPSFSNAQAINTLGIRNTPDTQVVIKQNENPQQRFSN